MERVHLETAEELRAELDRWRGLVDHLPALVAFWDAETRNVVANAAYLDWFGLKPSELRGMLIRDVLGERLYALNLPYITGALAGEQQRFERTLVTPGGETRHSLADYVPEVVGGEVIGFYVLVSDITAQVEAQRELDAAQELAHIGTYTLRLATQEVTWSREMFRIAGKDPASYVPDIASWMEMVHPDDLELARSLRDRGLAGVPFEASYRIVRDDGETRYVHSITRADVDDAGVAVLLRGTLQDQTEAQRAAAELAVANTVLTDMIGMLGHDLRQPVSVVQGHLETLEEHWDSLDDELRRSRVRTALRRADRMDALLQDLLALVNLDTARLEVRPEDLDVAALVEEVLERSPARVTVEIDDVYTVHADAVHLRQMLANLVDNAHRYGAPPVVLTVLTEDDAVLLSVRDHGDGVPAAFVPRLFERFTRASTGRAGATTGTGFGLYIVRRLAVANGGGVSYGAVSPHGAEFRLRLPLGASTSAG